MKVSICSIGKCENRYIREFVEFYKKLDVDKIYLYDNNDTNGEHFQDVISDYIDDGFVELIDVRGITSKKFGDSIQLRAYNNCYHKYGNQYDWMCFFDIDEYLILPSEYKTIKEWLSDDKFTDYGMIHVNWKYYGDNELLHYENKPLMERFTTPCGDDYFFENKHIKTIARGGIGYGLLWISTPHTPLTWVRCCDADGTYKANSFSPFTFPPSYSQNKECAYLRHFGTKTIEEYVSVKMERGFPDQPLHDARTRINLKEFFKRNKWTKEKEIIGKSLINKI